MATSPEQLKVVAENLCKQAKDEATRRAALSRAYYASYHACRMWHAKLPYFGIRTDASASGSVHATLLDQLSHPDNKNKKDRTAASVQLHDQLVQLRSYRRDSDYELDKELDGESVIDAGDRIYEIFKIIKTCPPHP